MPRLAQLQHWLDGQLSGRSYELSPASADASFRRYFRIRFADGSPSLIVMDAPPAQEDCRPWLTIAGLFRTAGVHVPDVLAEDLKQGFLLLSDLGNTTYLSALQAPGCDQMQAAHLYADAIGSLIAIQAASRPDVLPEYSEALLRRELMLFPEWYIGHHKKMTLDARDEATLMSAFDQIIAANLSQPRVFVHRDYHSRNLMKIDDGILDFYDTADALQGYIEVVDRRGERHAFPISSISLGVATNMRRRITSEWEASAVASEMKEYAKRQPGSSYQIDRRA